MINRTFTAILLAALVAGLPYERVSAKEPGATMRGLGMSDAIRGYAPGTSAVHYNPAGMSQYYIYTIEGGYEYSGFPGGGHAIGATAVDSATNKLLGAGASYQYVMSQYDDDAEEYLFKGHMIRGALSTGIPGKSWGLFIGAGVRYLDLTIAGEDESILTFDAGAILSLMDKFKIGLVGHNFINGKAAHTPLQLGVGLSYSSEGFTLAADMVNDFDTNEDVTRSYQVGLEYFVMQIIALRGGFQVDQITDITSLSVGLGYISSILSLDIGYRQSIDEGSDFVLGATVSFFIPVM